LRQITRLQRKTLPTWKVPNELKNLTLFANNKQFCEQFRHLCGYWTKNFPKLDILHLIQQAHSYQVEQKFTKQELWNSPIRGISRWLRRTADQSKKAVAEEQRTTTRSLPPLDPEEIKNGRAAYREHKERLLREGRWPGHKPEAEEILVEEKKEGGGHFDLPL